MLCCSDCHADWRRTLNTIYVGDENPNHSIKLRGYLFRAIVSHHLRHSGTQYLMRQVIQLGGAPQIVHHIRVGAQTPVGRLDARRSANGGLAIARVCRLPVPPRGLAAHEMANDENMCVEVVHEIDK